MGSDEDKGNVDEVPSDKDGKHPETVAWSQYVGIKEKFNRVEGELKGQVTSLEEKLKNAGSVEELTKVKEELETTKTSLQTTSDELNNTKEKTLTEKRDILVKRGIPEDKTKGMSVGELNAALVALEHSKPAPDMSGGGGGSGQLKGSPMELALDAYRQK